MRKMQVRSVAELERLAAEGGGRQAGTV